MAKSAGGRFETCTWLQLYRLHNSSDHGDNQETWALKMVCKEWESVEVWTRMMQYYWTHLMSCGNNPSQNPGTSFQRFPGDHDRGARWLSVFGMKWEAAERHFCEFVPGTFPMVMPQENQWLAQVWSMYVHGSKHHRNYSCFHSAHLPILPFTAILYVAAKSNQMWRYTPTEFLSSCMQLAHSQIQ